jgi:hypothetical protein
MFTIAHSRFRGLSSLLLIAAFLLACVALVTLAQDLTDLQRAREQAMRDRAESIDKNVKPVEGEFDLHDLFALRLDNRGFIKLTPNLPPTLGPSNKLTILGFPTPVRLDILDRDEQQAVTEMRFVVTNYNHAHAVVVESQFHWSPEVMVIDQMTRYLSGQNYIALIQQDTAPDDKKLPRGISLRIMLGDIPGQSAADTLQAQSFNELREKNWNEVEQYLRPILHELRLTSILSVDPRLAWQVFASEWEPDPRAVKQLSELLPALDAEDFKERRNVTQKLKELGDAVVPAILKLNRQNLTPEQNTGLDSVLASLLKPQEELSRLRRDPNFLADCLYSPDEQIVRAALRRINQLLKKDIELDPTTTVEQRSQFVERLRSDLTTQLVDRRAPITP